MQASDPAYDLFREDAKAQGFATFADYCRQYGIDIPDSHRSSLGRTREIPMHDQLDSLAADPTWTGRFAVAGSWGEPGRTLLVRKQSEGDDD